MARRRYKIGKYPTYDAFYEATKSRSPILNPKRYGVNEAVMKMSDKHGLEGLLLALIGNEEGKFFDPSYGGEFKIARIPDMERLQKAVEQDFTDLKVQAANQGKPPPSEMPSDIADRRLELEARLDVYEEEADLLTKHLDAFEAKAQEKSAALVLKRGPVGSGCGEPLRELDGQRISINGDGQLFIDDPRSPYHLMTVLDYREHVIAPFMAASKPKIGINKAGQKVVLGMGGRAVKRENLPPWPSQVPRPPAEGEKQKGIVRGKKGKGPDGRGAEVKTK